MMGVDRPEGGDRQREYMCGCGVGVPGGGGGVSNKLKEKKPQFFPSKFISKYSLNRVVFTVCKDDGDNNDVFFKKTPSGEKKKKINQ